MPWSRIPLMFIAAFLAWRIFAQGLAAHYVEKLRWGDQDALEKAAIWDPQHPEVLYQRAVQQMDRDPEAAQALLRAAYVQNPADARPLLAAAERLAAQGDRDRGDALVAAAVQLTPADPRTHERAAAYWVQQGEIGQALMQWSLVLEADPKRSSALFPLFFRIAEDPKLRKHFRPLAENPPDWWEDFFQEAAKVLSTESLQFLYGLRQHSEQPILQSERKFYVERLLEVGEISEAYLQWVDGLNTVQRGQLGLLYDGGFELAPENWGFDWHLQEQPGVVLDLASTYGVAGKHALHILFERTKRPFQHVWQRLFLGPGPHALEGTVRIDSLDSQGGLRWVVRCKYPLDAGILGMSDRFLGSSRWQSFRFEFQVPQNCLLQELALVSAGKRPYEWEIFGGGIWFDRLRIQQIPKLSRPQLPLLPAEHPTNP